MDGENVIVEEQIDPAIFFEELDGPIHGYLTRTFIDNLYMRAREEIPGLNIMDPIAEFSVQQNAYELVIQVTVNGKDDKFNEKITQVTHELLEDPRIMIDGHEYSFGQATWTGGINV